MTAFLFFAAFVLTVVVCIAVTKRNQDAFKNRFPPISDAEFLALCPPGTNPEVALKVRRIVAKHFAVDYECIHPSARFMEDFGAD